MTDLQKAKELLYKGKYTCVICKDDKVYTSDLRGVKPLVIWYSTSVSFDEFSAADKVVGKATAFLYLLLGVKFVYASVISRSALTLLKENDIVVEYETLVDYIVNRNRDGVCPFEKAVLEIREKTEAYNAIRAKMDELNIKI